MTDTGPTGDRHRSKMVADTSPIVTDTGPTGDRHKSNSDRQCVVFFHLFHLQKKQLFLTMPNAIINLTPKSCTVLQQVVMSLADSWATVTVSVIANMDNLLESVPSSTLNQCHPVIPRLEPLSWVTFVLLGKQKADFETIRCFYLRARHLSILSMSVTASSKLHLCLCPL